MFRVGQGKGPNVTRTAAGTPANPTVNPTLMLLATITHTQLQAGATTNDIEFYSLPAKGFFQGFIPKVSVAFAGTGITAYTLSLGIAGELDRYTSAFNAMAAVADTTFLNAGPLFEARNFGAVASLRIAAISTGANLSASTAGTVLIYGLVAKIP